MGAFGSRAAALGSGLGVEPATAAVYGEAEVRASTAFVLSSLLSALSAGCAAALGGDGYEVLVGGSAEGVLVEAEHLDGLGGQLSGGGSAGVVALLRRAEGDEEVTAAGAALKGIVLLQAGLPGRCAPAGRSRARC